MIALSFSSFSQKRELYVAAKTGLSIREKPSADAKVLDKIPYGTKITLLDTDEELKPIKTEGFNGMWQKVTYNKKTGYIVDSYLFPVAPPKAGTKTMKEYFGQISTTHGNELVIKNGQINFETDGSQTTKQLYKNGTEWSEFQGYEYSSMAYFIPEFTIQQAFLLVRLIPEFSIYIGEKQEFITANKKFKKDLSAYEYSVEKELFGDTFWIKRIKVDFEEGAIYNFEIYQINNQVVVFYGSGV